MAKFLDNNYDNSKSSQFEELYSFLENKNYKELKERLEIYNPVDVTDFIDTLNDNDIVLTFRLLKKEHAIEVFSYLDNEAQLGLIRSFTDAEIDNVIKELYFDDMVDMIEEMPASMVKKILARTDDSQRKMINEFLNYPEHSAGSLMTIEYVELKAHMSVREALQNIKTTGIDKETIYTCYVTSSTKKLLGFVSLRTIVTSDPDTKIEEFLDEEVIFVHTDDDQEKVADMFLKYGFVVLPVVDREGSMTGIITVDDIMDVIEQEATEDFQKMAAMEPDSQEYLQSGVFNLAKHRITWLLILMISSAFTGTIMKGYADVIQTLIVLNMFIPMIMDAGGNAGSQSSTLIIRGLATGEIQLCDWNKVLWKEFRVSFIVGIILATVNFCKCFFFDKVGLHISILVSITLMCTIGLAKMVGGILPLIAKKIGIDPAIMAGPLITTIVDAISLVIYFNLAMTFIKI